MPSRALQLCLAVCTLSACGSAERPLSSAQLFKLSLYTTGAGPTLTLQQADEPGPCTALPKVKATQNGVELMQTQAGDVQTYGSFGRACVHPEWAALPISADEESTTFVLTDGTATVTAEFQAVNKPRSVQVVAPANSTARVGQRVTLQWFPATDRLTPQNTYVDFTSAGGIRHSNIGSSYEDLTVVDGRIDFTVTDPQNEITMLRSGELEINATSALAGAARCEGVPTCEAQMFTPGLAKTPFNLGP